MVAWLDELRLEPGPPFLGMGTRALNTDTWLIVDAHRDRDLAYKAELLADVRPTIFAAEPKSDPAAEELLELVRQWLHAHGIEPAGPTGDNHPVIEAARLVQEDVAILERNDREWVLTSGVVAFPTHWTIADKIGLPLAAIHGPVAHYDTELREKVDRFHDRLTPERPVWRRNWVVVPTEELHLPVYGKHMHIAPEIAPDGSPMWLRSERQTLRRLPRTGAIVFTIRIQHAPLGVLLDRPDLAAKMLTTVHSWDPAKRGYTSTGGVVDALVRWLATAAPKANP